MEALNIQKVLSERGQRYGTFYACANTVQQLKELLDTHRRAADTGLEADQAEALDMICHKMARIINGDPNYADSWADIAGYATLVADRLFTGEKK